MPRRTTIDYTKLGRLLGVLQRITEADGQLTAEDVIFWFRHYLYFPQEFVFAKSGIAATIFFSDRLRDMLQYQLGERADPVPLDKDWTYFYDILKTIHLAHHGQRSEDAIKAFNTNKELEP